MSGHSKWSTIKRKKGAADAKRGKIFTKLIRELQTAARLGGGDVDSNPRLRLVVDKAKTANMPKDNIQRAIQKGLGGGDQDNFEEMVYEGYGPGGTAILIETLSDNKNRTVGDLRYALSKNGGNLGASGCVAFLFEKRGVIGFDRASVDGDALLEAALEKRLAHAGCDGRDPSHVPAGGRRGRPGVDQQERLLDARRVDTGCESVDLHRLGRAADVQREFRDGRGGGVGSWPARHHDPRRPLVRPGGTPMRLVDRHRRRAAGRGHSASHFPVGR